MKTTYNKQFFEPARYRSSTKYHSIRGVKSNKFDIDNDNIFHESVTSSKHKHNRPKEKKCRFSLLTRLLSNKVGKKWDDIYKELCSLYDKRNFESKYFLRYLEGYVEKNIIKDNGEYYIVFRGSVEPLSRGSRFYVDPDTKILCRNPQYKSYGQMRRERLKTYKEEQRKNKVVLDPSTELRLIDGIWYEIKFVQYENDTYIYHYDILEKRMVDRNRVANTRRTLSKKELKKYKLATST